MNVAPKDLDPEGNLELIQRSIQQDKAHRQFLIAINEDTLITLSKNLQTICQTKNRLEIVMHAFGFKVNASAFIENILMKQGQNEPQHALDDYFCIEFAAKFSLLYAFADLKKILNDIRIDEFKVIRDRMGSQNLTIRLSRANYQKLLDFSPDFLASVEDIVTRYSQARERGKTLEAEASYDVLCHLINAHTQAVTTQTTQIEVPKFIGNDNIRRIILSDITHEDPFNPEKHVCIITQLPSTKRHHQCRDWQTTLLGLVYEDQLTEQKKWDIRDFFHQIAMSSFSEQVQSFEIAALHPNGLVGRCLQQNRKVLFDFLKFETHVILSPDTSDLAYIQSWKDCLKKMQ